MTLTIEAIYENGVLKPAQPLDLSEGAHVRVLVTSTDDDPLANVIGICDGPEDAAAMHDKYIYRQPRQ